MIDLDVTRPLTASSAVARSVRHTTSHAEQPIRRAEGTSFFAATRNPIARGCTQALVELGAAPIPSVPQSTPIDRAAATRLALLVRKHEGTSRHEDKVRFDMLTQRLRQLIPRATPKDFERVEELVEKAEHIALSVANIKQRLGMK